MIANIAVTKIIHHQILAAGKKRQQQSKKCISMLIWLYFSNFLSAAAAPVLPLSPIKNLSLLLTR
jgi:hypothetical protein